MANPRNDLQTIIADTSIGEHHVAHELSRLIEMRGRRGMIFSDGGTEFTAARS